MDPKGWVTMYTLASGACEAVIDVGTFMGSRSSWANTHGSPRKARSGCAESADTAADSGADFCAIETSIDGVWLAAITQAEDVIVVSLQMYFASKPDHKAEYWEDIDVLVDADTMFASPIALKSDARRLCRYDIDPFEPKFPALWGTFSSQVSSSIPMSDFFGNAAQSDLVVLQ